MMYLLLHSSESNKLGYGCVFLSPFPCFGMTSGVDVLKCALADFLIAEPSRKAQPTGVGRSLAAQAHGSWPPSDLSRTAVEILCTPFSSTFFFF